MTRSAPTACLTSQQTSDLTQPVANICIVEVDVFSKHDHETVELGGPTLSIAISHSLPGLRHLAHPRAVIGARPFEEGSRTYGAWELIFPEDGDRPEEGYERFGVRRAVGFEDFIEVFDVYQELEEYEGLLRYRAQDLGEDEKSRRLIAEGTADYVQAARQALLWDPECRLDIPSELDKLFLERDWSPYVGREALIAPACSIDDIVVIARTGKELLVRFRYHNGESSGFDMEFVDLEKGTPVVRNTALSALRSPAPAFRGDQLASVYAMLQSAVDSLDFARQST